MTQLKMALLRKMDRYFTDYVLPVIDPSKAVWLFSLSGGIDSWACRDLIRYWYEVNGVSLNERSFHINQWNAPVALTYVKKKPDTITMLDAQDITHDRLNYVVGDQAPCSTCSGVRHDSTDLMVDTLLSEIPSSDSVVVARGHHMSDLAVSLLWRYLAGKEPASAMLEAKKGHPFQALKQRAHLAKPLIYVLKSEIAAYAEENQIAGECACVACPAHNFPSRRDIVNETAGALLAEHDSLWELSIPGVDPLFEKWTTNPTKAAEIRAMSQKRPQPRHDHMPFGAVNRIEEFYDYHLDRSAIPELRARFSIEPTLDGLALPALLRQTSAQSFFVSIPIPKYLYRFVVGTELRLSRQERLMLLCMGPFWGSFILPQHLRDEAHKMSIRLFPRLRFDDEWSHVGSFLKWYASQSERDDSFNVNG